MEELKDKKCIPCTGDVPPLEQSTKEFLLKKLNPDWKLVEGNLKLQREFKFKNFKKALEFTNKVGAVAEEQFHHPDLAVGWGYVRIVIQTHKINNLVESDFILAAKVDELTV